MDGDVEVEEPPADLPVIDLTPPISHPTEGEPGVEGRPVQAFWYGQWHPGSAVGDTTGDRIEVWWAKEFNRSMIPHNHVLFEPDFYS